MGTPVTVIVGASHAGVQVAASLRDLDYPGEVVLIGDETHLPYHRPPLSKSLLHPHDAEGQVLRPASFYAQKRIGLRLSSGVDAIEPGERRVRLRDGETIGFDTLVLATGARARRIPIAGADRPNVLTLRALGDAVALSQRLAQARDVVVLGAGMIGLEFAAVAAAGGRNTTVIDTTERPLLRAVSVEMASYLKDLHEAHGVRFLFDNGIARIEGKGRAERVVTLDGQEIQADLVLIAAGVLPNVELAAEAGLAVDNGIVVDANLQTSAPGIYAVGDCAAFVAADGRRLRIESVQNATDQARCVAAAIVGRPEPYAKAPWFWSDQYTAKLQIAGLWTGYDRAIRRDTADGSGFALYLFAGDRLVCVEAINATADHVAARKILGEGIALTPMDVQTPGFDPKAHMRQRAA
ncbi:FAD-dependent oxidoreductase [Devosia sp. PTR5]|uniref:FAD-dependent oxidoreductase n=1 Tax=Devosia oryzisoli TaxID=2774138 RepID=A0A927FTG6_9HYPH|nr:FAD-dependent oxidoreductase [Devosia oryzisoli]MBD8065137.1 FAD-dependent oxidoreductase [Devosia oryzisoli]